jgi:hypothetical protein
MEPKPFLVDSDRSSSALYPLDLKKGLENENWLQEILRKYPEILPVAQFEEIYHPLVPIGRELTIETGAIDNLFISHRGYLVLVETKLWRNPEAKREVLAQAIDYGSAFSRWTYDRLDEAVKNYTKKYESKTMSLFNWVEHRLGPIESDRFFFEETVSKNLRLGRFLTLIVGDRIRQSLIDMLDYVNKYPSLAMDVALVELKCFRWKPEAKWPLLIIPKVVARTEVVERTVVQVNVHTDGSSQFSVEQVKKTDGGKKRVSLTEEAYWELLKKRASESVEKVRSLIDGYRDRLGVTIEPSESAIVARFNIQDSGQQASLFFVDKNALLCVWPDTIYSQLGKAGLDNSLVDDYRTGMVKILDSKGKRNLSAPINNVNLDEFNQELDRFIELIEQAEPVYED